MIRQPRSWLFAPGHDEKLLGKVFDFGADMVLRDLEDAVPPHTEDRARARDMVALAASSNPCWVRVNRRVSEECARSGGTRGHYFNAYVYNGLRTVYDRT